jgi:hypothetical protein
LGSEAREVRKVRRDALWVQKRVSVSSLSDQVALCCPIFETRSEGPIVPWGLHEEILERLEYSSPVKALFSQVESAESLWRAPRFLAVSFLLLGPFRATAPTRRPCVSTRISALYPITARGSPPANSFQNAAPVRPTPPSPLRPQPSRLNRLNVASPCHARR